MMSALRAVIGHLRQFAASEATIACVYSPLDDHRTPEEQNASASVSDHELGLISVSYGYEGGFQDDRLLKFATSEIVFIGAIFAIGSAALAYLLGFHAGAVALAMILGGGCAAAVASPVDRNGGLERRGPDAIASPDCADWRSEDRKP